MSCVEQTIEMYQARGHSQYGGEAVTQMQHALQAATLAERDQASPALIVAALLHDIGHLLHSLPDDAPEKGIDDHHETSAGNFLKNYFPESVSEPVRLHVAAKRYLCAVDADYMAHLSPPSITSLALQGGPMSLEEVLEFQRHPYSTDAVRLRRWDDEAKDENGVTPTIEHFAKYIHEVQGKEGIQ